MAATVRDSTITVTSGTSISPTLPTYSAGDVMALIVWGYTSFTTPTGYTSRNSYVFSTPFGSNDGILKVFTKTAASESSPTMTHGVSDECAAVLIAVQGADTTTPVDGTPTNATQTDPAAPTAPSITDLAGSDSLLICGSGVFPSSGGGTQTVGSTGMTEIEDGASFNYYMAATLALASSAATGTKAFTKSGASGKYGLVSFAIKSAGGGTTATAESAGVTATANNVASMGISPTSESAGATAAAGDATTKVAPTVESAGVTATANDATVSILGGTNVNAECATATAVAEFDVTGGSISVTLTSDAAIELTATANDAAVTVTGVPLAECATATAVANNATVTVDSSVAVSAQSAAVTATANNPSVSVKVYAECATASVSAGTASVGDSAQATFALADGTRAPVYMWDGTGAVIRLANGLRVT